MNSIQRNFKCACCENEHIIDWESYTNLPGFLFPVGIELIDQIDAKELNLKYCNKYINGIISSISEFRK